MLIRKNVRITIQGDHATLDENFYLYKNDRNVDILFELINFKFDFIKNQPVVENAIEKTNATYSGLRVMKPNGEKVVIHRCPIENNLIKFTVTPEFIDEMEEVGIYQLQITLYDEFEGRITIPPISFEVLEPLFEDDPYFEEGKIDDPNNENTTSDITNIVIIPSQDKTLNDLNGRVEIASGTNLYEWQTGDWISDIRLNTIQDNILRLDDKINNAFNDEEDIAYPIQGGQFTTTIDNEEVISNISLSQVTICNQSENEIHIVVNYGEEIPLEAEESLSFGDVDIYSIVIVEKNSTVKYIGI